MIQRKSTFLLGIFIAVVPFLGLPTSWKTTLIVLSGILLIFFSIKITLPKKNTKARTRREKITPVFVENAPIYPRDNTIESSNSKINSERTTDAQ